MEASEELLINCLNLLTDTPLDRLRAPQRDAMRELRSIMDSSPVVGIGIGERAGEDGSVDTLAMRFYVFNKSATVTPRLLKLVSRALAVKPHGTGSISVEILELGDLSWPNPTPASTLSGSALGTCPTGEAWFPRAVQPGYAIKHFRGPLGTFGAVVMDSRGQMFALSNCHVLALCGAANPGDEIDYPGLPGPMGNLHRFIRMHDGGQLSNVADAAIASFSERALRRLDPRLRSFGTLPAGEVDPRRGMVVTKIGLDGKETLSRIVDVNFRAVFPSADQRFGFRDQILCYPRFGGEGDSGALVLEKQTRRAVGLNFASTADSRGSVCCPLAKTLAALEVALVSA